MPHMDLKRAQDIMKKRGVDVLIASTGENFYCSSGYRARPGWCPAMTLIPADPALAPAMIVSNFIERQAHQVSYIKDIRSYVLWVCLAEEDEIKKGKARKPVDLPQQYDTDEIFSLLSELLKEKGLHESVIGIERNLSGMSGFSSLAKQNPKVEFINGEKIFWEIRQVKTEEEIQALKEAVVLAEVGIRAMIEGGVKGATIGELHLKYKRGIWNAATSAQAMSLEGVRAAIASGDFFHSEVSPNYRVAQQDIIFIDNGVTIRGYTSDMGRTFSVGKPSELQNRIFSTLKAGYEDGLTMIKPGVKLKEVYWTVQDRIHRGGLDWHCRGHMGHMVGIGAMTEQPPWIAKDEETVIEPNMVLCLEIGTYLTGRLGAFQIEDVLIVNSKGYESINKLPRDMIEL